jgi:hypothetical protein
LLVPTPTKCMVTDVIGTKQAPMMEVPDCVMDGPELHGLLMAEAAAGWAARVPAIMAAAPSPVSLAASDLNMVKAFLALR